MGIYILIDLRNLFHIPHVEILIVMCTYTRDQVTERARCKISNTGYLSLNIFVILCHNMVIRSWDVTTIPKGLSETLFGRF